MSNDGTFAGASDHNGWAILVTVAPDGTLLDRRRVELVDPDLPTMPHHHEAQGLPLDQGIDLVDRVRASAEHHSELALDTLTASLSSPIRGIAIRKCPPLPATTAERLQNYRAQNVADTVMYRQALAGAAESRGWTVFWYDPGKVIDAARGLLQVEDIDAHFLAIRQAIGPPWRKDHRVAMAAAIVAASSATEP